MNIGRRPRIEFSPERDQMILESEKYGGIAGLAALFGVTRTSIRRRKQRLAVGELKPRKSGKAWGKPYTAREDELILAAGQHGGIAIVAERLGRSKSSVYTRRTTLAQAQAEAPTAPLRPFDPFRGNEVLRARAMARR